MLGQSSKQMPAAPCHLHDMVTYHYSLQLTGLGLAQGHCHNHEQVQQRPEILLQLGCKLRSPSEQSYPCYCPCDALNVITRSPLVISPTWWR